MTRSYQRYTVVSVQILEKRAVTSRQQTEDAYTIMVASSTMLAVLLAVDVG